MNNKSFNTFAVFLLVLFCLYSAHAAQDALPIETRALAVNAMRPQGQAVELQLAERVIVIPAELTPQEKNAAELLESLLESIYQIDYKFVNDIVDTSGLFYR